MRDRPAASAAGWRRRDRIDGGFEVGAHQPAGRGMIRTVLADDQA
jgi:hypothetical protein